MKVCAQCSTAFQPKIENQRFCSRPCNKKFHGARLNVGYNDRRRADGNYGKVLSKQCVGCGAYGVRSDAKFCSKACFNGQRPVKPKKPKNTALAVIPKRYGQRQAPVLVLNINIGTRWSNGKCRECDTPITAKLYSEPKQFCSVTCARRDRKHRRKARKRSAPTEHIYRAKIYERDNYTCQLCQEPLAMNEQVPHPQAPTIDHIIPLARGGAHLMSNLQAAHFMCNCYKSDNLQ